MTSPKGNPYNKNVKGQIEIFDKIFLPEFRQKGYIRRDMDIIPDIYSFTNMIRMRFENKEGHEIMIIMRSNKNEPIKRIPKMGD